LEDETRKPYSKPVVKQIQLNAEEAVLAGCKTAASPTGRIAGNNNCGNRDLFCDAAVS
jgi:hypothetical protein